MAKEDLVRVIQEEVARYLAAQSGAGTPDTKAAVPAETPGVPAAAGAQVPVAISNRHIHLAESDWQVLFGGRPLTRLKDLSQPGEFAAQETVTLVGPKGVLEKVRVLGPLRQATQVELARTDAIRLGVNPPVRDSGRHDGTAGLTVVGPTGSVMLQQGVILALRHIHMTPADAARLGVQDKEFVAVQGGGDRSVILGSVLCRVSPHYRLELHLDTDEANAGLFKDGDQVTLLKGLAPATPVPAAAAAPVAAAPESPTPEYDRKLLTEDDVRRLVGQGLKALVLPKGVIVTALALDAARGKGLRLIRR